MFYLRNTRSIWLLLLLRWTPSRYSTVGWLPGASQQWSGKLPRHLAHAITELYPQQTTNQYFTFFSEVSKLQLPWEKLLQSSCILYDRCAVSTGREARRVVGQTTAPPPAPITLGPQHIYIWPKYHYRPHYTSSATCPAEEYLSGTFPTLPILPSVL